jgi:Flp pilus assembly protein TadD
VRQWLGRDPAGFHTFADAFDAHARHAAGARAKLINLAQDRAQPAIVRASALRRLSGDLLPGAIDLASGALNDRDELVRRAAVEVLALAGPEVRARYLPRMVEDPVRAVRISAARALASLPDAAIPEDRRVPRARALEEYLATQRYTADRPEAHLNLAALHQERGELDQAEAEYRQALALYPDAVQPLLGLAEVHRLRGDEARAQEVLSHALRANPASAPLHHALGLSNVRQQKRSEALAHLARAARLAPDEPVYAYIHGVALDSYGEPARALAVLERAHARFPGERSILFALATMQRDRGNTRAALGYAQRMVDLAPDDAEARALLTSLE